MPTSLPACKQCAVPRNGQFKGNYCKLCFKHKHSKDMSQWAKAKRRVKDTNFTLKEQKKRVKWWANIKADPVRHAQHKASRRTYDSEYTKRPGFRERVKSSRRKALYGLDDGRLTALLAAQAYKCPICALPVTQADVIDHDHATGQVRGILHRICNVGLGHFADDRQRLLNAVNYLTSPPGRTL